MVKKRSKRVTKSSMGRMIILFFIFNAIVATMGYTLIRNFAQAARLKKEFSNLKEEKNILLEKEEAVQADIKRLSDPEYVARYVREKHFFSRDNEIILRMDD